jgi:hypothetical protein
MQQQLQQRQSLGFRIFANGEVVGVVLFCNKNMYMSCLLYHPESVSAVLCNGDSWMVARPFHSVSPLPDFIHHLTSCSVCQLIQ